MVRSFLKASTIGASLLVQVANTVIMSEKYPECKELYRRIKACHGHKKAIIAVCRMLLAAIWNFLSTLELYSAKGYLADKLTENSVVISNAQGSGLFRKRGYILTSCRLSRCEHLLNNVFLPQ